MSTGIIMGNVRSLNVISATWDIPSVAANTTEEETLTLSGVKSGDFVIIAKQSLDAGILFGSARVSAADTVAVQITNPTSSAVDASSQTVHLFVIRPESVGTGLKQ